MLTRRSMFVGLLAPLVAVPVVSRAWDWLFKPVPEWTSFSVAGVEITAFRTGDVLVGADGRRWVAGIMPSGQCGLRSVG